MEKKEMEEQITKTERPDSISFGTPGTGVWKIYVDMQKPDEARELINNGAELFKHAQAKDKEARG
jgi:hypothetical protein